MTYIFTLPVVSRDKMYMKSTLLLPSLNTEHVLQATFVCHNVCVRKLDKIGTKEEDIWMQEQGFCFY